MSTTYYMDFSIINAMAQESRKSSCELELRRYGRKRDVYDLMVGFVGDVYDLS